MEGKKHCNFCPKMGKYRIKPRKKDPDFSPKVELALFDKVVIKSTYLCKSCYKTLKKVRDTRLNLEKRISELLIPVKTSSADEHTNDGLSENIAVEESVEETCSQSHMEDCNESEDAYGGPTHKTYD